MQDLIVTLITTHQWLPLSALVIGAIVRLVKSDTKLPIDIPAKFRPWLALGLGQIEAGLIAVIGGMPVGHAVVHGLVASLTAMVGHVGLIEVLRGGQEVDIPGLMKPLPEQEQEKKRITFPPALLVLLALLCSSCTPAQASLVRSALDAIAGDLPEEGRAAYHVLTFCEESGASPTEVLQAVKELQRENYAQALALADKMVAGLQATGVEVPRETALVLDLAKQLAAVKALEAGMRSLDGRDPETGQPLPPPSKPASELRRALRELLAA